MKFAQFVAAGTGLQIWNNLKQQIYLGDDAFMEQQLARSVNCTKELSEVPHKQSRPASPPLRCFLEGASDRNQELHQLIGRVPIH